MSETGIRRRLSALFAATMLIFFSLLATTGCSSSPPPGNDGSKPIVDPPVDPALLVVWSTAPEPLTVSEPVGETNFTVALAAAPNDVVVLTVTSSELSELTIKGAARLTFTPSDWSTPQTVVVAAVDDNLADGSRDVTITLEVEVEGTTDTTGYADVGKSEVPIVVQDDDDVGFSVDSTTTTFAEDSTVSFTILLDSEPNAPVVFDITSSDDSEVLLSPAGSAAPTISLQLTIAPDQWDKPQQITLNGQQDNLVDGDVSININIAINSSLTTDTTGYSGLPPYDVPVTVQNSTVPQLTATPMSLSFAENAGTEDLWVRLSSIPDGDVAIDFVNGDPAKVERVLCPGEAVLAPIVLNAAIWASGHQICLASVNNTIAEDDALVDITFEINAAGTSDTTGYDSVADAVVALTIVDDDTPGAVLIDSAPIALTEAELGVSKSFRFTLTTEPVGNVVVTATSLDLTEVWVSDCSGAAASESSSITVSADNWNTELSFCLHARDDLMADGQQNVPIAVSVSAAGTTDTSGYLDFVDTPLFTTIAAVADNDKAGLLLSAMANQVSETGTTTTFNVSLTSQPSDVVVLTITSLDPTEAMVSDTLNPTPVASFDLSIAPEAWSDLQTITVTGQDDILADGNIVFSIEVASNGSSTLDTTGYGTLISSIAKGTNIDIDPCCLYVRTTNSSDANSGTDPTAPKTTLPAAISAALVGMKIYVAQGIFNVDGNSATLVLRDNVSLYGGYASDFSSRAADTFVTTITDTATSGGTPSFPNYTLKADAQITSATFVDGFTIQGGTGSGNYAYAIHIDAGSPTIRNNTILGGAVGDGTGGIDVRGDSSAPLIVSNTIDGGGGNVSSAIKIKNSLGAIVRNNVLNGGRAVTDSYGLSISFSSTSAVLGNTIDGGSPGRTARGIRVYEASPTLWNNVIFGGTVSSGKNVFGVDLTSSNAIIQNNTIDGGSSTWAAAGISFRIDSAPIIENNIIAVSPGATYRLFCISGYSNPASLRNNVLYGCTQVYYDPSGRCTGNGDADGQAWTCNFDEMVALGEPFISGNVSMDPMFLDAEKHLHPVNTPVEIREGGLDLSADIPIDKDGKTRTVPLSMGAYEDAPGSGCAAASSREVSTPLMLIALLLLPWAWRRRRGSTPTGANFPPEVSKRRPRS